MAFKKLEEKEIIYLFLLFLFVYTIFIGHTYGSNDGSRIALTKSLVDYGTISIDGYINYTRHIDYSVYNNKTYSDRPPLSSFMAVPIYLGIKALKISNENSQYFIFTFFMSAVASALLCVLFFETTKFFSKNNIARVFATVSFGFGTLIFPFSTIFMGHNIVSLFLLLSFYYVLSAKNIPANENKLFLAGASAGLAFLTDYPTLLIGLIIFIYSSTIFGKRSIKFLLPMLAVSSLLLAYNYFAFDDPLKLSYDNHGVYKQQIGTDRGFSIPTLDAIINLTITPFKGLFVFSPILLMIFYGGLKLYYKNKLETKIIALIFISYFILISSFWDYGGGWSYGPRYLIPILPFISLLLLPAFDSKEKILFAMPLLILSIIIMLIGAATNITQADMNPIYSAITVEKFFDRTFYYKFILEPSGIPAIVGFFIPLVGVCLLLRNLI